ncbi:MAG TPA: HEPN domain-containing protein [Candidatus Limnocylindria bacterium]|nr:HEPN domain-containing protein [Candidatus Limnocylindria bacterium]
MKPEASAEAGRWLAQAERDLAAARDLERAGHFNVACFQAQQAAEKAATHPDGARRRSSTGTISLTWRTRLRAGRL